MALRQWAASRKSPRTRASIGTVLLPARNRKDLEDIPPDTLQRLRLVWLDTVDDALREALEPLPASGGAERDGP